VKIRNNRTTRSQRSSHPGQRLASKHGLGVKKEPEGGNEVERARRQVVVCGYVTVDKHCVRAPVACEFEHFW
jgi:hypothetical protein